MHNINKPILIFLLIVLTICTAIQIYIINYYLVAQSLFLGIEAFISLLGYLLAFVYIFNCLIRLRTVNKDLQLEILNNKILSDLYDKTRTLKHDFANIIQAFGGYIWAKDLIGLKNYYSNIMGEFKTIDSLSTLKPNLIKNPSIYILIVNKYYLAKEKGITINVNVETDLQNINTNQLDFIRTLGILLDNSIEACLECDSQNRIINLKIYELNNCKSISIENTYLNKNINLDKIFEKDFSTKNRNTGIGLWEVKQYLNKTKNINLETSKTLDFFKQELSIS